MEHLAHFLLIFGGLFLGLIIWFWDSIKNKRLFSFKVVISLFLFAFILLHAAPLGLIAAAHHQAQDQATAHPCCIPQTADVPIVLVIPELSVAVQPDFFIPTISIPNAVVLSINNKSPPFFV